MHALVIGTNRYEAEKTTSLCGVVADADKIKEYLTNILGIPRQNIHTLCDEQITIATILQVFMEIKNDDLSAPNDISALNEATKLDDLLDHQKLSEITDSGKSIKPGDHIIFFAGHGVEAKESEGWQADSGKTHPWIQLVLPAGYKTSTSVNDPRVHGIPERSIAGLLWKLTKEKGDNTVRIPCVDIFQSAANVADPIQTVIVDCFHFEEVARGGDHGAPQDSSLRCIEYDLILPSDLDEDIWMDALDDRAGEASPGFLQMGLCPHEKLSACGSEERAYGVNVKERGYGFSEMLDIVTNTHAEQTTYAQLIRRVLFLLGV